MSPHLEKKISNYYEWEFFSNGQVLENGTGNNFQQIVVPDSIYAVHWSATDPFGNQSDTTITYQFMDGTPPTTICTKGLEVIVDGTTMDVIITTDSLNDGTFDNCDDQLELGFFLWHESMMVDTPQTIEAINQLPDSVLFNCVDTGAVTILLYSTDQSGNFSSCASTIQIIENPEIECDETMLTGTIANRFGQPINGATIEVTGNKEQLLLTSNEAGRYEQMLPMHRPYTIRPYLQKHPLNGVSTYDIILLSKHIIGEQLFESPYQYIAADINRSGHVTVFDAVQLRQLILNKIQDFPNNTSWRFINADYTFQTKQPLTEAFPESYDYQSLTPEQLDMDFVGVKIGDISGDADTHNLTPHTQLRNTRTTVFIYTNPLKVEKGKTYQIVINAPNWRDIIGFQTTFKFHDLILTNFTGGMVTSEQTHGWQEGQEGFLTISCNSNSLLSHDNHTSRLFTLTVKATKDGALQELLTLASSPTPTEVYSLSGNQLGLQLRHFYPIPEKLFPGFVSTPLSISAVGLPSNSESGVFELFQNYPNPFTETTTIKFHLPKAAITALSLFDIHGQTILQTQQHYETGTHTILLNSDQLTSGAYFYQVATPFGVATKKMMIVK